MLLSVPRETRRMSKPVSFYFLQSVFFNTLDWRPLLQADDSPSVSPSHSFFYHWQSSRPWKLILVTPLSRSKFLDASLSTLLSLSKNQNDSAQTNVFKSTSRDLSFLFPLHLYLPPFILNSPQTFKPFLTSHFLTTTMPSFFAQFFKAKNYHQSLYSDTATIVNREALLSPSSSISVSFPSPFPNFSLLLIFLPALCQPSIDKPPKESAADARKRLNLGYGHPYVQALNAAKISKKTTKSTKAAKDVRHQTIFGNGDRLAQIASSA